MVVGLRKNFPASVFHLKWHHKYSIYTYVHHIHLYIRFSKFLTYSEWSFQLLILYIVKSPCSRTNAQPLEVIIWFIFNLKSNNILWMLNSKVNQQCCYFLDKWEGYLLELHRSKQASTWMSIISKHMSLIYWAMCLNMSRVGLVVAGSAFPRGWPQPSFTAQIWLQFMYVWYSHAIRQRQGPGHALSFPEQDNYPCSTTQ
jgi:hypothetical protein